MIEDNRQGSYYIVGLHSRQVRIRGVSSPTVGGFQAVRLCMCAQVWCGGAARLPTYLE